MSGLDDIGAVRMESTLTSHRMRRLVATLAVAATVAALSTTGTGPVSAQTVAAHRIPTVTSGNARFQILSPTLIRTEYAGDGRFVDSATFNAIGRSSFTPTPYTSTSSGGVLTIRTSALTMRYQEGTGPFDAQNLTVALQAGAAPVTATPWQRLTCTLDALCEAEDLAYNGLAVASDHSGYTGSGFLAGFQAPGNSLSAPTDVSAAGTYQFDLRYANSQGGDGQNTTRTLSLSVDGGANQTVTLPVTGSWDNWSVASVPVTLAAGQHTVTVTRTTADSGNVNVDSVALVTPGNAYPASSTSVIPVCRFDVSCEAEAGRMSGTAITATDHAGFAGPGFVAELNQGAGLTERISNVPADGTYSLNVRYANGIGGDGLHQTRTATVSAAGTQESLSFPATTDWDTWGTVSAPITLHAGTNDVTIGCPDTTSCHVNADTISVSPTDSAVPQPHLALGGYRRSLDGVNGDNGVPATTPGLLHTDGWYLLDDTQSALYDPATRQVTQRASHAGLPYQDGYVFGFGHDYQGALTDLSTLTGPPELLPRWAYGVWYSEYMDRTAADYENTILPGFRANGVPLDVLVTDTDFKSPNTWSGWEMDPAKFPDPSAFFAWSAAQGLHNTLNIHPSIASNDPQFAQAQATAGNTLQQGGCASGASAGGPCYTFDWGNPDQLKAYMDLHQRMDQEGNDFWWLDWCCDGTDSSLQGVTPDAWINQQYALDSDKAIGRGFVLSRAYGSLQSGTYAGYAGLPTGPWADKRTTIHFTGDTSSTWSTLADEVGYTPGESAATGLSAVSDDIGGFNDATGLTGSETYTSGGQTFQTHKLPDDMYARWVQFGTFQPIDRLHGNHSDRLPWQYGPAAQASAQKFLNLRENLVPYTYSLAQQANATGIPVVRPMYLEYPEEPNAYATSASEYLYGPDVLVAPVTTPGTTATTSVWFPPGQWTDYFTGQTYAGGTTQNITTDLGSMPVFVKAGGIVPTRTGDVTNDVHNPLTKVTLSVATGAPGSYTLYEDNGSTTDPHQSTNTTIRYSESGGRHTLTIGPAVGHFTGEVADRQWTVAFLDATAPTAVTANGVALAASAYHWDATAHTLTITLPQRDIHAPVVVGYR